MPANEEPTIGKLVGDLSKDVSSLISNEIALAKSELKFSVKAGGIGAAMFGAAAFLLLLAVIMLSVAIAYLINFTGLDLAWCFLIVFGLYVLIALLLAYLGWKSVKQVGPPERSIAQLKETKAVLKRG
ncbi:MAG: phage holin family protein [Marmoricola sp.]